MNHRNSTTKRVNFEPIDYAALEKRFLNVELDLTITFCETGFLARDMARAERCAEHARTALDTFRQLPRIVRLTEAANEEILQKFAMARALLSKLERQVEDARNYRRAQVC